MISIKQFLEQRRGQETANPELLQASLEACSLLLDAVANHTVRGRDADYRVFEAALKELLSRMNEPPDALSLLGIASEAIEAMDNHTRQTSGYLREQNEQMQSIVGMLTDTLADVSGQADASVARLQGLMEQAATTEALLAAEKALSERQERLESLQSQRAALADQVELSTLSIHLEPFGVAPVGGPDSFSDGLGTGWRALVTALHGGAVALGVVLPWLALVAAVVGAVLGTIRLVRRRTAVPAPAGPPQE